MADSELGELRRAPRPPEARIARMGGWRSQGLVGGTSDTPVPVDYGADGVTLTGEGDDGEPTPEWFAESFTLTSAAAATRALTYTPVAFSEVLRLNGVTLVEGVDYTLVDNVVTWTDLTDLIRGIGSDSWTLAATYPYYDTAVQPEPTLAYVVGGTGGTTITMSEAIAVGDVCVLALQGDAGTPTGAFATWTQIRNSPGPSPINQLDLWLGEGVGTGLVVTVGAYYSSAAVFRDVTGTVTVSDTQSYYATDSFASTMSAPAATAVVGNIVVCAVRGMNGFLDRYVPDGTHTDTGFTGLYAMDQNVAVNGKGVAVSAGIATATSVDCVFGMLNDTGTGFGEAVNIVLTVT